MRNLDFIKEIEKLFQQYYEKTVWELRSGHPQFASLTNTAVIRMQDDYLLSEISARNPHFKSETLTEFQKTEYGKALVQQIFYALTEGDFCLMSGYDVVNNTFAENKELERRYISPAAKRTLTAAGLFYSAISGGRGASAGRC